MQQKIVSQLDADGYFVGPAVADPSPLEQGVYLFPGGAIDVPPPEIPHGTRARWNGTAFEFFVIPASQVGPAPELDLSALRRAEILARLAEIDAESIRPAREVSAALVAGWQVPIASNQKLLALEQEAEKLRTELKEVLCGTS